MRVLACVNQKGGVGKTTLCANLAYAIARRGKKVLVIDMDPQGHLGQCFGFFHNKRPGMDSILRGEHSFQEVTTTLEAGLNFVPAGVDLLKMEAVPMGKGKGLLLKKALKKQIDNRYEYIFIDCPPSSGFLVVNALAVANELLIPVTPDYFGLSGLSMLMTTVKNFEAVLGNYQAQWLVVSRKQSRKLTKDVLEKLQQYFGNNLAPVQIAERAVLAECPSFGKPIMVYAPNSPSSREFQALAKHIDTRQPPEIT